MPKHASWQDWFGFAGLFLAYLGATAKDEMFMWVYAVLATASLLLAVRSHQHLVGGWKAAAYVLALVIGIVPAVAIHRENHEERLKLREDSLKPANFPMPLTHCPVPMNALVVFLGKFVSVSEYRFPHHVISVDGENLLTLDKAPDGGITLSFKIFDDRRNIIAHAEQNKFWVDNGSRMERPNDYELRVFDHLDNLILDVKFLNHNAFSVVGEFRGSKRPWNGVLATADHTVLLPSRNSFTGACVTNAIVADIAIN